MARKAGYEPAAVIDGIPVPLHDYTVSVSRNSDAVYNKTGKLMGNVQTETEISGEITFPVTQWAPPSIHSMVPQTHTMYLYADVNEMGRRTLLTDVLFSAAQDSSTIEFVAQNVEQE